MTDVNDRSDAILKRQAAERAFEAHVAVFLAANVMLAGVRALLGARPVWPVRTMSWWGIGLAFHRWSLRRMTVPEDEIRDKGVVLGGPTRRTLE
jgi:hypothetical protein